MWFSQLPSENNSFLQTENPKCYTDTAAAEALQPITKREEFSMSQKKRIYNRIQGNGDRLSALRGLLRLSSETDSCGLGWCDCAGRGEIFQLSDHMGQQPIP